MRSKKGSMELGVNAIVVLIIALVILGLGIGFVTGLFKKGGDQLGSIVDRDLLPIHATADKPIAFEKEAITMKQKQTLESKLSLYNHGGYAGSKLKAQMGECYNENGVAVTQLSLVSIAQDVPQSTDGGFVVFIKAEEYDVTGCDAPVGASFCKGTYICNIEAGHSASGAITGTTSSTQIIVNMVS